MSVQQGTRTVRARKAVVVALVLLLAITWVALLKRSTDRSVMGLQPIDDVRPKVELTDGYVSSAACRECHTQEYHTWHRSYHRTMTQPATPDAVSSPWSGSVTSLGRTYQLERDGDEFLIEMDDPEDPESRIRRRVVMTTGSHHMQLYWYETGRSRTVGLVPISYLLEDKRWVPRKSVFLGPPSDHSPPETGRWNDTCCQCHSTHPRQRLDAPESQEWDTHVVEFGISCEACHGPGAEHVASARAKAVGLSDSIVNPSRLSHRRVSAICGQCHVTQLLLVQDVDRFQSQGFTFRPGQLLNESEYRHPVRCELLPVDRHLQDQLWDDPLFLESQFWPDGMNRVTGREYNSLIESACFQRGTMSCLSCHIMHPKDDDDEVIEAWRADQLSSGMHGDQACLQCHEQFSGDVASHTHHGVDSTGSRCMNCHMPHTSYGLLKAIRSHQIESPSLDTSLKTGRPIACNLCHLDKTLHWTDSYMSEWYGQKSMLLQDDDPPVAASINWMLKGDAGQRALLAWAMGWKPAQETSGTDWMVPYLHLLMTDPYDAVRQVAHRSLNRVPGFEDTRIDLVLSPNAGQAEVRRSLDDWAEKSIRMNRPELLFSTEHGFLELDALRMYQPQNMPPLMLRE